MWGIGDRLEEFESFEGFVGHGLRLGVAGGGVAETFHGEVHGGVLAIVVVVDWFPMGGVIGVGEAAFLDEAGGADVSGAADLVIEFGFFGERHGLLVDGADAVGGGDPGGAVGAEGDVADVIIHEPALAVEEGPLGLGGEAGEAGGGADPELAGGVEGEALDGVRG